MAIKIGFDMLHRPEEPTFVLAKKNGDKIGLLLSQQPVVMDSMTAPPEIFFGMYKYLNGKKNHLWDELTNFKLVWCKEWDTWFEIRVEIDEDDVTIKNVYGKRLGEAELLQIMLYDVEINTETDISREEYDKDFPTLLYREDHPEASLLHRLLEKAPHYSIAHVDASIAKEQRTFTFDDKTIYEALQEIGEELQCFFTFDAKFENDRLERTVSVYDLQAHCNHCGHRGDFIEECPKCGSKDVNAGYGKDTTIFITADAFAKNIQFSTNTDSVKNCFKLKAGDDLMTETIRNCNPNGSDYIWYISPTSRKEMSQELQEKLAEYDNNHAYYQNDYVSNLDTTLSTKYNQLVTKYKEYYKQINNHDLSPIATPIKGYPALMTAYYDTIDLAHFLKSSLMPNAAMDDTDADAQLALLTTTNLSPVALTDITNLSNKIASVDSAVLAMAKVVVDSTRYQIKIASSSISGTTWSGKFTVTNYSDEEDTATSTSAVSVTINSDYKTFVTQKMQKALKKKDAEDLSISGLFKSDIFLANFKNKIRQYGLNSLTRIHDACQACIDILIEQGIANKETWSGQNPNLYNDLYLPHYNKLHATEEEISVRQSEINTILGVYDSEGDLVTDGLQTVIIKQKNDIQDKLDIKKSLGENLWLELNTFRREQTFSNDNYISDGKTNTELFEKALEFIDIANNELIKSSEKNHEIVTSLNNILTLDKFQPLVDSFQVGNWMRVRVDDKVYRLRMLKYTIDFYNIDNLSVEFSDVMDASQGLKFQQSVIRKSINMGKSYDYVQRQAKQGAKGNEVVKDWTTNGLDATNTKIIGGADNQTQTWDEHGMLFRKYDSITDKYDDEQLKIINSTLAVTKDNWRTVETAVGRMIYQDPEQGVLVEDYGVNARLLVSDITLSKKLKIFNASSTMKFTDDEFVIEDAARNNRFAVKPNDSEHFLDITLNEGYSSLNFNTSGIQVYGMNPEGIRQAVIINPSDPDGSILNVRSDDVDVLKFNEKGDLEITGEIHATGGTVSMFSFDKDKSEQGLTAYFDGGTKQYGLGKNRFFAFFRNAVNKFVGHIDLDNGVIKDENGETHLGLSLGSVGNVSILSNSKIQFGSQVYDNEGVASWTAGATINGASGRIETNDVVKYNGTIPTTSYANTCAFDSTGMIKRYVSSSKRYKHDITENFDETTDYRKLLELPVVTYRYNEGYCDDDNGELHIGFIAEDIDKVFPVGCNYKDGQPENWNVMEVVPAILKLVQEQNETIKEQGKTIDELKAEIDELKKKLK